MRTDCDRMGMSAPAGSVVAMAGEGDAEPRRQRASVHYGRPRAGNRGAHRKAKLRYPPFSWGLDEHRCDATEHNTAMVEVDRGIWMEGKSVGWSESRRKVNDGESRSHDLESNNTAQVCYRQRVGV